ncbi:MAG: radical family protein [Alphaproteobacteria bacterium]|nr:radical family protein [Alphaproteobacteria bacterium]
MLVRNRPLAISNLELHVAHSCNLACESCSHYSDHGHKGLLALDEARRWMEPWAARLAPAKFSLLGGEPAIHPELAEFVPLVRGLWPKAQVRIATNGLLLHRHPDLPRRLAAADNAVLEVSIHHASDAYRERLEPVFRLLREWIRRYGINVGLVHSYANWTRRYNGFGAAMAPFKDDDPRSSWEHCPAKHCPQLLDGAIAKCGPIAYLPMQDSKYRLSDEWRPYLDYQPLVAGCSDAELAAFFARQEEPICAMCTAAPERFALASPLRANGPLQPV